MKGDEKARREERREYKIEPISLELSTGSEKFKAKQNVSVLCCTSVPGNNLCFHPSCAVSCTNTVLAWLFRAKRQDHALPSFLEGVISYPSGFYWSF